MSDVRLRSEERLKSRKQLSTLFEEGRSTVAFPLRFVWMRADQAGTYPVRVAFSVSRKNWRKAVDRNLLKRRMREAYRLNKHLLYDAGLPTGRQLLLVCLYTANVKSAFEQVQTGMCKGLKRIAAQLSQTTEM